MTFLSSLFAVCPTDRVPACALGHTGEGSLCWVFSGLLQEQTCLVHEALGCWVGDEGQAKCSQGDLGEGCCRHPGYSVAESKAGL